MSISDLFLRLGSLSPLRYTAAKCGHRTKRSGSVSAFGCTITTKMPMNKNGSVDYCLDCIGKMAIRCAWCGDPIFIGNPITLYSPGPRAGFFSSKESSEVQRAREQDDFVVPDGAAVYRENPLTLVGCLGWNCADTGADRAGFWLPGENGKGRVHRVQTAYEAILRAGEPSMMIVGDTHDTKEALNPTLIPLESQKAK